MGKLMSKAPGLKELASPAKIETLIRGYTASFGNLALDGIDWILEATGAVKVPPEPAWKATDLPGLRGFRVRFPSANTASIEKFYKEYERLTRQRESYKERAGLRGEGVKGLNQAFNISRALQGDERIMFAEMTAKILSSLRKKSFDIRKDPDMEPEEKRKQLDATYLGMINAARIYFGKKGLK
jgi:hypothetical protein